MTREELRAIVNRAIWLADKYFHAFSPAECLGLTCFPDDQIEGINFAWSTAKREVDEFSAWLAVHHPALYQKYAQHLIELTEALKPYMTPTHPVNIHSIQAARRQLGD